MKFVVATAHDAGYAEMAAITLPTVEQYCKRHGYELYYDPNVDSRETDACKIRIFCDLYASGRFQGDDRFFWIDTDALVMNSEIHLDELAAIMQDYHYMVGYDANGINTGTWMARFTSHADHYLRVSRSQSIGMGWADQVGLLQTALQAPFCEWVRTIPGKYMNAMPYELYGWDSWPHKNEINNYEPGDFVLHLPGIEHEARLKMLRDYAQQAR